MPFAVKIRRATSANSRAADVTAKHGPVRSAERLRRSRLVQVLLQLGEGDIVVADLQAVAADLVGELLPDLLKTALVDVGACQPEGERGLGQCQWTQLIGAVPLQQALVMLSRFQRFATVQLVRGKQIGGLAAGLGVKITLGDFRQQLRIAAFSGIRELALG